LFFSPSQLNEKEDRENIAVSPEEGSNEEQASGRDESSPKVDVMN
jgi:hypothetical protein